MPITQEGFSLPCDGSHVISHAAVKLAVGSKPRLMVILSHLHKVQPLLREAWREVKACSAVSCDSAIHKNWQYQVYQKITGTWHATH